MTTTKTTPPTETELVNVLLGALEIATPTLEQSIRESRAGRWLSNQQSADKKLAVLRAYEAIREFRTTNQGD